MQVEEVFLPHNPPIAARELDELEDDLIYSQLIELDDSEFESEPEDAVFEDAPDNTFVDDNDSDDDEVERVETENIIKFYNENPGEASRLPIVEESSVFEPAPLVNTLPSQPLTDDEHKEFEKFDSYIAKYAKGAASAVTTPTPKSPFEEVNFDMSGLMTPTSTLPPPSVFDPELTDDDDDCAYTPTQVTISPAFVLNSSSKRRRAASKSKGIVKKKPLKFKSLKVKPGDAVIFHQLDSTNNSTLVLKELAKPKTKSSHSRANSVRGIFPHDPSLPNPEVQQSPIIGLDSPFKPSFPTDFLAHHPSNPLNSTSTLTLNETLSQDPTLAPSFLPDD